MMLMADDHQTAHAGDVLPEFGSSSLPAEAMDHNRPWGWVLENLLDVKTLSHSFLNDIIEYVEPLIQQPQCSKLLQKVALRYLDEAEVTGTPRKLDTSDVLLLRFILNEQGISDLHRIHSLKESLENDLTLRVETEAVLTNLRCSGKEGRGDWAAFKDAVDSVFSEDMLEACGAKRRKELIAVLQDRSKGEPEKHLCKELLEKYPLEELCRDLARFVDDKRKCFEIKFLDQLAKDVENGVYSFSPGSDSPEPRSSPTLPGSTHAPCQNYDRIATRKNGDSDPRDPIVGACVPRPKDVTAEMSLGMCGVDEINNGLKNVMNNLMNNVTQFTKDVQDTPVIPCSTPDLSNQQSSLAAPVAGNLFSMEKNCVVMRPAKRAEVHLESDELEDDQSENRKSAEYQSESLKKYPERDTRRTSSSRPEKVSKRRAVDIIDQVTGVAKKTKFDDGDELSGEQRTQRGTARENGGFRFGPILQKPFGEGSSNERLSSENVDNAVIIVHENCNMIDREVGSNCRGKHGQVSQEEAGLTLGELSLQAAGSGEGELNAKCYFCGSSGGCLAVCHRCSLSIHESCLSKLCSTQVDVESCWYCFACAVTMAQEGWRKAQECVKKAEEALRKAEEAVLTTQERLAAFASARRERSREHREGQNVCVEFGQGAVCGIVIETTDERIKSMHAALGSSGDFKSDPEVEDKATSLKSGLITEARLNLSGSTLLNVMDQDAIRQSCRTTQDVKIQTDPQASVHTDGLNAVIGSHEPGNDFPREIRVGQGPTSVPSSPVSQDLPLRNKHGFGYCVQEQSKCPRNSVDRDPPMIPLANNNHTKSSPCDMLDEYVEVANAATNGSEVPVDHGGDSSPSRASLFNRRNPEAQGDGHDGDLEEVCEGNRTADDRIHVAEEAVETISEKLSEESNVAAKSKRRKVYRGRSQVPGVRRQNLPWTKIEEDVLKEGVNMFSNKGEWGFRWKQILEFGAGKFHESRTTVDLKDKWRNMRSKQN